MVEKVLIIPEGACVEQLIKILNLSNIIIDTESANFDAIQAVIEDTTLCTDLEARVTSLEARVTELEEEDDDD